MFCVILNDYFYFEEELYKDVLKKFCKQHPTKQQLYGHLPPISQIIQVRRIRCAEHCCRSKDKLKNNIILWTPTHGHTSVGRPVKAYTH